MSIFNTIVPSFNRTASPADSSHESGPVIKPFHRITETTEAYGLTVHLAGVERGGLEITADQDALRITGRRTWRQPEGWTQLHRESADANYELVLEHDHTIDVDKVHAELKDGVLRVSLPKTEAIKPRKITLS